MDYYKILGINESATQGEIKKAYKKLAKKLHPDKKGGNALKFAELAEAFEVLSDINRREDYDNGGTGDDPNLNRKQRIKAEIVQLFISKTSGGFDPENDDIFGLMIGDLNRKQFTLSEHIEKLHRSIAKIEEAIKRVEEKRPFFIPVLENSKGKIEKDIENISMQIKETQESIAFLSDFGYRIDCQDGEQLEITAHYNFLTGRQ